LTHFALPCHLSTSLLLSRVLVTTQYFVTTTMSNLQSLKFSGGEKPTLSVLDQLKIPHEKVYIDIPDCEAAWEVIRSMQIRGTILVWLPTRM